MTLYVPDKKTILIVLNIPWDGAALGQHKLFESQLQWVQFTVDWILNKTDFNVYVRQHPAERFSFGRSNDQPNNYLNDFITNERLKIISATDQCNTYFLVEKSDLIITLSSSLALESLIMGKQAISVSNCYYVQSGVVDSPKTVNEYLIMIKEKLLLPYVTFTSINNASLLYYIAQELTWIETDFLPSDNIKKWLSWNLDTIFYRPYIS